jgi:hypothetical protein
MVGERIVFLWQRKVKTQAGRRMYQPIHSLGGFLSLLLLLGRRHNVQFPRLRIREGWCSRGVYVKFAGDKFGVLTRLTYGVAQQTSCLD